MTTTTQNATRHSNQQTHTSLYRKYRPDVWEKVVGQQHIVQVLREEANKVKMDGGFPGHAFLFAGSRGTGKTTIARIFAQEIGTAPEDIYEIDAASNTSVEDIRALNEAVHTLPLKSRFKVYILDEVHMLSKSAFNAFLKTLEEPPKHVIFILATTELHKIPETIMSRCQVFHFARPTASTLTEHVIRVASDEGVKLDEAAANRIAMLGNGSFRDTLSHLQTVCTMARTNSDKFEVIDENVLSAILMVPSAQLANDFVYEITSYSPGEDIEGRVARLIKIIEQLSERENDISLFVEMVISALRMVMLKGVTATSSKDGAKKVGDYSDIIHMIDLLLEYSPTIGKTAIPTLPLELAVMKFGVR